jgi:hypothetical protein
MPRVTVMPLSGEIRRDDRLGSLRGCHAITERSAVRRFETGHMAEALESAMKELMLADRFLATSGKLQFVVEVALDTH